MNFSELHSYLLSLMPDQLSAPVLSYLNAYPSLYEIRLRLNQPLSFTVPDGNISTSLFITGQHIKDCLFRMTDNQTLRFRPSMLRGIIELKHGCRAGIYGSVLCENGQVSVLQNVYGINLRLPKADAQPDISGLLSFLTESGFRSGVLIISPPGMGKTTVLRSLSVALSKPPFQKRVALIDTDHELSSFSFSGQDSPSLCDCLVGYPKAVGIDIAVRYLNPELILCDELGTEEECSSVLRNRFRGVPIITTAHARDYTDLMKIPSLSHLIGQGVFGAVDRLWRDSTGYGSEIQRL